MPRSWSPRTDSDSEFEDRRNRAGEELREDQLVFGQPRRSMPQIPHNINRTNTQDTSTGAKTDQYGHAFMHLKSIVPGEQDGKRKNKQRRDDGSLSGDHGKDTRDEDFMFRCHPYSQPVGGDDLYSWSICMEVPIRTSAENDKLKSNFVGTFPWPQNPGTGHVGSTPIHLCYVAAAKRWIDGEGQHRLDLTSVREPENATGEAARQFQWLHVETASLDFDEYRTIALNTPNLSRDWKIVILSLLTRVRKLGKLREDSNWRTWVMRADSAELTMPKKYKTNLSAISASFPYFAVGDRASPQPASIHGLPGAGLFEHIDRNLEQSLPRMVDDIDNAGFIYAAHVWSLLFDKTLITYGPISYDKLCSNSISLLESNFNPTDAPRMVQIVDEWGCETLVELRICDTYFSLRRAIERLCLRRSARQFADVEVLTKDNKVLTGKRWIEVMRLAVGPTIQLFLRNRQSPTAHETSRLAIHAESGPREFDPFNLTSARGSSVNPVSFESREKDNPRESVKDDYGISQCLGAISILDDAVTGAQSTDPTVPTSSSSSTTDGSIDKDPGRQLVIYRDAASSSSALQYPSTHFQLGRPLLLDLIGTRRDQRLQHELRRNWQAEGVILDIPAFIKSSTTRFLPDAMARDFEVLRLDTEGIIAFDLDYACPQTYTLPKANGKRNQKDDGPLSREDSSKRRTPAVTHEEIRNPEVRNEGIPDTSQKTEVRDIPIDASEQAVDEELARFLDWASNDADDDETHDSDSTPAMGHVERILQALHEARENDESVGKASAYKWMKEAPETSVETLLLSLRGNKNHDVQPQDAAGRQAESSSLLPESEAPGTKQKRREELCARDQLHVELFRQCTESAAEFHRVFTQLLDCYLPATNKHSLIRKCWGAFELILSKLAVFSTSTLQDQEKKEAAFWVVRDASSDAVCAQDLAPSRSWDDCKQCTAGTVYPTREEAVKHVQSKHYRSRNPRPKSKTFNDDILVRWVRDDQQYRLDQRLQLYSNYMSIAVDYVRKIRNSAISLREGVARSDKSSSRRYKLPGALLKAFENVVLLMMYAALSFQLVDSFCKRLEERPAFTKDKETHHRLLLEDARDNLDVTGSAALLLMAKAEQDLMLLAYTDYDEGIVRYDAVGPEYVLGTVMANLAAQPLHNGQSIENIYAAYYENLSTQARTHPRAKTLRDIFLLREEIAEISTWTWHQKSEMEDYIRVLEPCGFRTTTKLRCVRYETEDRFLYSCIRQRRDAQDRWRKLDARLSSLNDSLYQMLRVSDEKSANAIMVFTIVATIFLPLSWATSYLGMNTADIRELRQGQWLFWTVAGPLASSVISVALVAAWKGEEIRDYMGKQKYAVKNRSVGEKKGLGRSNTTLSMIMGTSQRERASGGFWSRVRQRTRSEKDVSDV